jgi:hypothetical protein
MTPAFDKEENETAPDRERLEPCAFPKKKFFRVDEAVVEVAMKYGAAIFVPDSMPPAKVEVAEVVAMMAPTERLPF